MVRAFWAGTAVFVGLLTITGAGVARADLESAKKYVADATRQLDGGDAGKAETALDLAEAELDGVAESDAGPVKQQIEALRKKLGGAADAAERQKLGRQIDAQLQSIKRALEEDRFSQADDASKQLEEFLADPQNQKILGEDAAKYQKQLAPLRKVAVKKMLGDKIERVDERLKRAEEEWPQLINEILGKDTKSSQEYSIRAGSDQLDRIRKLIAELPADEEPVKALNARLAKLQEQYASAASAGAATAEIARVTARVESVEQDWPGLIEQIKDVEREGPAGSAARDAYGRMEMLANLIQELPPGDERVKDLVVRRAKMQAELDRVYASASATKVLNRLKESWDGSKERWQGWDAETTGPTFQEYAQNGGSSAERKYNMPRTLALRQEADRFFYFIKDDESYAATAEVPEIKAIVDEVRKLREQAQAKLVKAATDVVAGAEQANMEGSSLMAVQYMDGDIRMALGDEAPEAAALIERRDAILKKHADALAAVEKAQKETFEKLSVEADKAWPAMAAKFPDAQDGFDPGNPPVGKTIRIRGIENRMGWDYGSDDLPFAARANGKPFAARYDPIIAAAFREVAQKVGGNRISDEGWDLIAIVEPGTVRITQRIKSEVRDAGGSSVGSLERWDPIEVPVVKVVALHAGPVAAAVGAGAAREDGTVEAPRQGSVAPTGGSASPVASIPSGAGTIWLRRILVLLVGLAAAAACLMKAGYAPLAATAQAGAVQAKLGGDHLWVVGLVCAGLGVFFLLWGLVIYGLITNLAIIAAGLYAAMDWLVGRGLVKPETAAQFRPLGVPIGMTCAALVIVSLLCGLIGIPLYVI